LRYEHKALIPAAQAVIVVIEVMIAFVGTEAGIDTHEVAGVIGRPRTLIPGGPRLAPNHPMAVAHTTPPVKSVTPAMKIAVSTRVSIQLLRMVRLNRWTVSE